MMKTRTSELLTVVLISFVITTVGCATGGYYISEKDSGIIHKINVDGVGSRRVISGIGPVPGGRTATYRFMGGSTGGFLVQAPYGGQVRIGDGSVLQITGKVSTQEIKFDSDEQDPLTFLVSQTHGLVYMYGRGTVTLSNGESIILP